jgi:polar amino acid transport system substrate-binding protein
MSLISRSVKRGRAVVALALLMSMAGAADAQAPASTGAVPDKSLARPPKNPAAAAAAARTNDPLVVPSFWDPRHRPDRPDLSRLSVIRFLTETDYPPFNYVGPDGVPTGFNVELAREICNEIEVQCTIQMRRFDTLVDALNKREGDAIIASFAQSPQMRKLVDFSNPYYRTPARFVALSTSPLTELNARALEGKKVAVVAGTAHAAYLKNLFTEVELKPYKTAADARAALKKGEVDLLFGDGVSLAFWLNGTDSDKCCEFRGGPYLESRFFGEGVGIAVRKGNALLRRTFNWALFRLWERGRFTDLWLRYFPISPF